MTRLPKILYVDDDAENLIGFETSLANYYDIITTTNTSEVNHLINENNTEVVVLDYKMPEINGIELADQLFENNPDIAYIITSAYADMELVVEAINHHKIFGFVPKPWNFSELGLLLNNALKYTRTQKENKSLLYSLKIKNELLEKAVINEKNANKLKTNFLKNISHEIRTPLNVIIGFNQLALLNSENEHTKKSLNHSLNGCYDLLQIITNIVTASKLISSQVNYFSRSINLYNLIDNIISSSNKMAEYLKVQNDIPTDLTFNSDPNALIEVIKCIVDNAIKFAKNSTLKIFHTISNNAIEIHFKDSGPGISENSLAYIFEPFRQEDETDVRKFGGTGLGLFIVKKHIENLKGEVNVISKKGNGAEFIISLPQ